MYALHNLAKALKAKFDKDGDTEVLSEAADRYCGVLNTSNFERHAGSVYGRIGALAFQTRSPIMARGPLLLPEGSTALPRGLSNSHATAVWDEQDFPTYWQPVFKSLGGDIVSVGYS
jgi:hypothetical protein